jgi:hypothetical protein
MPEYTPRFKPGSTITLTASAAITGGQLVAVSGDNTVAPAGAGSAAVIGQAANDTASGAPVAIHTSGHAVHVATAAAIVTAGAPLKSAAAGQVTPWVSGTDGAQLIVGIALAGAAAAASVSYLAM